MDLHQTPMILMHMTLSILCFKLACGNSSKSNGLLYVTNMLFKIMCLPD